MPLKQVLYRSETIRAIESRAIHKYNLGPEELMSRAGAAAWKVLHQEFPQAQKILVFCGGGNNAGDGFVLAQLAHEYGLIVTIYALQPLESLPDVARRMAQAAIAAGVACQLSEDHIDADTDLIVDALLGIGAHGEVREPIFTAINQINDSEVPVMSLDIPSGLQADSGQILGACVRADVTMTFIAKKLGMMMCEGPDYCGKVRVNNLRLEGLFSEIHPDACCISAEGLETWLPRRPRNCHKGNFGQVLIIGGNIGMPGAVILAAKAALRVGAGLVTIATKPEHTAISAVSIPEAMIYGIEEPCDLDVLLDKASVCLIGPGLGDDAWAQELFYRVIGSNLPMVIDASALRLLGENPQHDDNWVLTPHPGEAASLLHCETAAIQQDRYGAIRQLQQHYGGTIVLKGVGSLIATEKNLYLCDAGNPGMASPGMGDTLSGVIAGFIAQGLPLTQAANLGVYVHACAADLAVENQGERGLLASDLLPFLRQLVNPIP